MISRFTPSLYRRMLTRSKLKATSGKTFHKGKTTTELEYQEREWKDVDGVFIEHDVRRCRFLGIVGTGERPYLSYLIDESAQTLDIRHTYVPAHARGRGVAHALCNRAFQFAKDNHYEVIPTCSYVKDTYLVRVKTEAPSRFEFGK